MPSLLKNRTATFDGLGSSIVVPPARAPLSVHPLPDDRMEARAMLHDCCPLVPGVYAWLDAQGQICYVGKSKSLRKRLLTYFAKTPRDTKAVRIRQHAHQLVWEPGSNELFALLREQELIHRWRPDFNIQGQPTRRQPAFLCVSQGGAPRAYFAHRLTTKANHVFGPIAGTGRLRAAAESLNQVFRLRDCPDKTRFEFNDQQQLFSNPVSAQCIRFELGSCPAPCAGRVSSSDYQAQVDQMLRFLTGTAPTSLATLHREMQQASAMQRYERAAVLRDHLKNLQWLDRRLHALRTARQKIHGVLPLPGRNQKTIWLILRRGQIGGSIVQPNTLVRTSRAIRFLRQVASQTDSMPRTILEMHFQLIMISWFRKMPDQQKSVLSFEKAIQQCRAIAS